MNFVDILIIAFVVFGGILGFRKGVIRSLVQLVGAVCVAIIAYSLKGYLANFLMGFLPFFDFGGVFRGVPAMSILMYELVSFVVIYVVLYCILNIFISLSGLIEKLLKLTIVMAIPSKILGLIVGAIEGLAFAFIIVFVLFHISATTNYVEESKSGVIVLERMPLMSQVMNKTTIALDNINKLANEFKDNENRKELNIQVLSTLIHYNIITAEKVEELGEAGKLDIENVTFS